MLTPQSTRGSPRDAPYDPATKAKKIFRSVVRLTLYSFGDEFNSRPSRDGEDGRISKGGKRGRRDLAPQRREATARVGGSRQRDAVVLPDRRRPERPPGERSRVSAQAARGVHGVAQRYWPSTCRAAGGVHDRE